MLGKLLKYDFKSLSKLLIPVYLVTLLLAVVVRVANMLAEKFSIFSVPSGFLSGIFIVVLIAIPIATFIFTIVKFYQSLIKDEGYLMHTLPVSKNSLVLSKTISSIAFMCLSFLFTILFLFVGVYGIWFDSKFLSLCFDFLGQIDTLFLILILLSILISVVFNQVMVYVSIALGQKHNNKILYSLIYGVVIYNVIQILSVIILLPFMLFDPNYQSYIDGTNFGSFELINGYLILALIVSLIFTIICYVLTVKVLDKKLNLE